MTDLPALSDVDRADLDRLCAAAHEVIEATRPASISAPSVLAVHEALGAIQARLVQAGVDGRVAAETVARWYITRRPLLECLAVEVDPPYPTSRVRADLGRRGTGPDR